jgi:hypothetical protein
MEADMNRHDWAMLALIGTCALLSGAFSSFAHQEFVEGRSGCEDLTKGEGAVEVIWIQPDSELRSRERRRARKGRYEWAFEFVPMAEGVGR